MTKAKKKVITATAIEKKFQNAQRELEAGLSTYRSAREAAVNATLRLSELNYCQRQGIINDDAQFDDDLFCEALENATSARMDLKRARNAVIRARARVVELASAIEREKKEAAAEEKKAWLKKHQPKLFGNLENAWNRYHEVCGVSDRESGAPGHAQRTLAARENIATAEDACDRAYAKRGE